MRIEHVALWTGDLERLRAFYVDVLGASAGTKYFNPNTGFESYFLSFADGARLELMRRPDVSARAEASSAEAHGWAHVAVALGSREAVDELAARLRARGLEVDSGPRQTGDGYYEVAFRDPDGNRLEATA